MFWSSSDLRVVFCYFVMILWTFYLPILIFEGWMRYVIDSLIFFFGFGPFRFRLSFWYAYRNVFPVPWGREDWLLWESWSWNFSFTDFIGCINKLYKWIHLKTLSLIKFLKAILHSLQLIATSLHSFLFSFIQLVISFLLQMLQTVLTYLLGFRFSSRLSGWQYFLIELVPHNGLHIRFLMMTRLCQHFSPFLVIVLVGVMWPLFLSLKKKVFFEVH